MASPLELSLTPLLGDGAPGNRGWTTYLAVLKNSANAKFDGTLTLFAAAPTWLGPKAKAPRQLLQTHFSVPAKSTVTLQLPASGRDAADVEAKAQSEDGQLLATAASRTGPVGEPLIFDTDPESRLTATLDGRELPGPPPVRRAAPATPVTQRISVTAAHSDSKTREAILPLRAASYAPATLVLVEAGSLESMGPSEVQALAQWIGELGELYQNFEEKGSWIIP